jgi:hypothetical protein
MKRWKVHLTVLLTALAMLLATASPTVAQDRRDPDEGEPRHAINELQNKLHHTDDPSKRNHLEGKIDTLPKTREQREKEYYEWKANFYLTQYKGGGSKKSRDLLP